ncbi:MAG: ABC-2 type transport system ATP-binding protein [Alphaproteobacteria bacterium]|nr:ABC-2 type transport system ATP-binding protein [Alphaproteobacteria bacterium]
MAERNINQMTDHNPDMPLAISGLSVAHNKKSVFEDLSLHVAPGEIFGLTGVNGAGKTSLIKAALSLLEPEAGEMFFFGVSSGLPASRMQVAYLPENFRPPAAMRGAQFVRLALAFHDLAFDRPRADALARAIDLDPAVLDARIATLSRGTAQKLGLLAAFLSERPLLILDEPMSGLDPRARILLKKQIQVYCAGNKAVFFSSHGLSDLEELCHRIAVLHEGALRFIGAPAKLCAQQHERTLERAFLSLIEASPGKA